MKRFVRRRRRREIREWRGLRRDPRETRLRWPRKSRRLLARNNLLVLRQFSSSFLSLSWHTNGIFGVGDFGLDRTGSLVPLDNFWVGWWIMRYGTLLGKMATWNNSAHILHRNNIQNITRNALRTSSPAVAPILGKGYKPTMHQESVPMHMWREVSLIIAIVIIFGQCLPFKKRWRKVFLPMFKFSSLKVSTLYLLPMDTIYLRTIILWYTLLRLMLPRRL